MKAFFVAALLSHAHALAVPDVATLDAEQRASLLTAIIEITEAEAAAGALHIRRELGDVSGAAHPWWDVGGFVTGWSGLKGIFQSQLLTDVVGWFTHWLISISNIIFVGTVALGYLLLPRQVMIYVGLVGLFVGPVAIQALLKVLGFGFAAAAYVPGLMVLLMWIVAFATSKTAQRLGLWLGLDKDEDGDVDWEDVLEALVNRVSPTVSQECKVSLAAKRKRNPRIKDVADRLDKIERILLAAHEDLKPEDYERRSIVPAALAVMAAGPSAAPAGYAGQSAGYAIV